MDKPPIGLRPFYIVVSERIQEINDAIIRYIKAGYQIPKEWTDERHDLIAWENSRNESKNQDFKGLLNAFNINNNH